MTDLKSSPPGASGLFAGGGTMGDAMRGFDWTATPLGDAAGWPQPLKTLIGVMLAADQPMFVAWGPARVLLYNDRYAPLLADRHPAALGRPFLSVWSEATRALTPLVDQVFAGEPVHMDDIELHLDRPGRPREAHFAFSYTPVRDETEAVAGLFCPCTETTEQVLAERRRATLLALDERLREHADPAALSFAASELLGEALNVARVGYGTVDQAAGTITVERNWSAPGYGSVSGVHAFAEFGGYLDDLRRGEPVANADVHHDPRTVAHGAAFEALNIGAFLDVPVLEEGRLSSQLFVHAAAPRDWTADEIALVRDVAERTRAAIARRVAESELLRLNETLEQRVAARTAERDRLWVLSEDLLARADYSGMMSAVSPAWTRKLGFADTELLARPYTDFMHPDDADSTVAALTRMGETAAPTRFENRIRRVDGAYTVIEWTVAPEPDGVNFIAVGRDVSAERRRQAELEAAQDALRQSQKMEAVGQLTGGIAHDFNNLLAGITGSLELIRMRLAQGRTAEVEKYVTAAQGAANRAASLTHRLLAFSRRQTLAPKPTDVKQLVAGMADLLDRTVGPAIRVETVNAVGLWPSLIDPSQLENAILNLAINARDAMPEGGVITIETANRWLDATMARERGLEAGQYISLCVSDSGTGMTADVIAKAFDPFFTTKPIGVGTGLGLSMIYGFAKQSGGSVHIYSEVGQGTNVCIYLPRHRGTAEAGEAPAALAAAPRGEGETVLVVDDEPTVRMLVSEVLADLGYHAIEAEDGAAGLRVLNSDARIDLLVTDVGLPGGMNGRQVADAARVERPGLKVLFITGYAENAVLSHGHLDPGMHVMTKPFAMEALASRIRELIA